MGWTTNLNWLAGYQPSTVGGWTIFGGLLRILRWFFGGFKADQFNPREWGVSVDWQPQQGRMDIILKEQKALVWSSYQPIGY